MLQENGLARSPASEYRLLGRGSPVETSKREALTEPTGETIRRGYRRDRPWMAVGYCSLVCAADSI